MMNKVIGSVLGAAMVLMATPVFAQTSTSTIQALLEQIKNLQAQIQVLIQAKNDLATAQGNVSAAAQNVVSTLKLVRQLRKGMTGDDVKLLQEALAADPSIYPEGLVTGFYGSLTEKAVARYQKKHGLEQVGNVGPLTLKNLNKDLDDNEVGEQEDEHGNKEHCAIVPPGHLIAPGWLRKHNNEKPIVPECQKLPKGIEDKLEGDHEHATSTPNGDKTAPIIYSVSVSGTTNVGTNISWLTNENATSKVWFSTTTPIVGSPNVGMASTGGLTTSHTVALTGLASSTTYYYQVVSADASGNTATSSVYTFATGSLAGDVTPPTIFSLGTAGIGLDGATIIWQTNESADSRVWYATSTPILDNSSAASSASASLVVSHAINLSGLASSTVYYYEAVSSDSSGNTATSSVQTFTTLTI